MVHVSITSWFPYVRPLEQDRGRRWWSM